jgi:hypothetical protein
LVSSLPSLKKSFETAREQEDTKERSAVSTGFCQAGEIVVNFISDRFCAVRTGPAQRPGVGSERRFKPLEKRRNFRWYLVRRTCRKCPFGDQFYDDCSGNITAKAVDLN